MHSERHATQARVVSAPGSSDSKISRFLLGWGAAQGRTGPPHQRCPKASKGLKASIRAAVDAGARLRYPCTLRPTSAGRE
jgi:hypothetical protein